MSDPQNRATPLSPESNQRSDQQTREEPAAKKGERKIPLMRMVRVRDPEPAMLIGYDYETTRIKAGTPRPLYITAFGKRVPMHFASRIETMQHLQTILVNNFLTEDKEGVKYVAWNGNNFDAYFTAAALVTHPDYVLRPYLTRGKSLRGLKVLRKADVEKKNAKGWEFLDGIAMTGLVGTKLDKFLEKFAPDYRKLKEVINFEFEEFDPDNPEHCAYAMRDSEGLYYGMTRVQDLMMEKFKQPLAVTMGGACIKILKRHIPPHVVVNPLKPDLLAIIRQYVMRGGYCYCVKRYQGPVWKYDINQAYAAAMRDARLPAGYANHSKSGLNPYAIVYVARIEAWKPGNKVPFYYRSEMSGKMRSLFGNEHILPTWVTSIEYEQLKKEGWKINVFESYSWEEHFNLRDYVDMLERGRMSAPDGPAGPEGTIYKNVGNHSYGKTVEVLDPKEWILSLEQPDGFVPFYDDDDHPVDFTYFRHIPPEDIRPKDYHQPHIGAFITAHVRMVVRRAALLSPDTWLYADTDCTVFSSDVTAQLDIDAKRYGAWKLEESGTEYQIIAKKVYAQVPTAEELSDPDKVKKLKRSAKGLHADKVTPALFDLWYNGKPPAQKQVQRQNFMAVMRGAEMYREQDRKGTRIEIDNNETPDE
jgi:hypothetical protein